MKKYTNYTSLICVAVVLLTGCGYMHKVYLRGQVSDVSGQALPGVSVRIAGTELEALTSAIGQYSLGATTGSLQLEFFKTGYAPARLDVTVETLGRTEVAAVSLWPLPISEGVYFYKSYRYFPTNHPRPNRYKVKDIGNALGTPVTPDLIIPWVDAESEPASNPPCMIGYKVPAYDARMHRLQRVNAALIQTAGKGNVEATGEGEIQYPEEVWIAETPVPLRSNVLDEPEKLLVELGAVSPLIPGIYAIHWGALKGYDSIEPRIFIFELKAPEEATEEANEEDSEEEKGQEEKDEG
jgi:hypothetical protein